MTDALSVNVPVPTDVARLASDYAADLPGARDRAREDHTLVAKRLTGDEPPSVRAGRARELLADKPAFAARIDGIDVFAEPTSGPGPVIYLAVESPGLVALHEHLCAHFDPVPGVEGEDYVPHVTIARGGDLEAARAVAERDVEPMEWVVDEVALHDAERGVPVGRVALDG